MNQPPTIDIAALEAYFATRDDVAFAVLFGSHARGQAGPLSDVDVAAYLGAGPDGDRCFTARLGLIADLTGVLKTDDVDVLILNQTPLALSYRILRDGVLLHCRDRQARVDFTWSTVSRYLDFKPFLERYERVLIERAADGELRRGYNPHRGALERHRRLRERLGAAQEPDVR